ncbi:hypothetical protein CALCODRAFT_353068 [Calocera cornea HHB12733]|uniref:Uncharacterized protein n=1 Tax=Calocera cornea HHB12733 TaxID=1353952 RepID=A0A165ETM3_9BASI|nr:hypothetical protein CALCODRAFT_353068 [Calocera cornea HHB12733]
MNGEAHRAQPPARRADGAPIRPSLRPSRVSRSAQTRAHRAADRCTRILTASQHSRPPNQPSEADRIASLAGLAANAAQRPDHSASWPPDGYTNHIHRPSPIAHRPSTIPSLAQLPTGAVAADRWPLISRVPGTLHNPTISGALRVVPWRTDGRCAQGVRLASCGRRINQRSAITHR